MRHQTITREAAAVQIVEAGSTSSTAEQFKLYLALTLERCGGDAVAYQVLGVARPVAPPPESSPEKKAELNEMYDRVAMLLKVTEKSLREKYGHMNPGLQIMNLKNTLRRKGFNT